jgi:exopolysaccharide biosynthesis polyprenyl glycosylphosphotransferase
MTDKHRLPRSLFRLIDLLLITSSFGLATALIVRIENSFSLEQFLGMRTRVSNLVIFCVALSICHAVCILCGLYESRRVYRGMTEYVDLLKATLLITICFMAVGSIFTVRMITPAFLGLFWVFNAILLCGFRFSLQAALAHRRKRGENLRHLLILGTNPRAIKFARKIAESLQTGYKVSGFVDDCWHGTPEFEQTGFQLVSDFNGLNDFLRNNVVDEIAIYLPFRSFYMHCHEVADLCQQHGIALSFNADFFDLKTLRQHTELIDGDHFITSNSRNSEGLPAAIKRALDVTVSSVLLLLAMPVLLLSAIAIKLNSPGAVLFFQERIGLNKRRFKIFKLRTMVSGAEKLMSTLESSNEASGPVFKMKSDPRITPVGKFLRASSIDELPQLWNVLKGDMSLVGPRPLPLRDYEGFSLDWQRRRFSVKPGITCLWQVTGRSNISFDQWMLLDIQYMDEWSVWLDIKILLQTIPAVFRGSGAM